MDQTLKKVLNGISDKYWGQYVLNQFYIKIYTGKKKSEIPSYNYDENNFSNDDQMELQKDNCVALYHKFIHHVHEISTLVGINGFLNQFIRMSIFAENVDVPESSNFNGIAETHKTAFNDVSNTTMALFGSSAEQLIGRTIINVEEIKFTDFKAFVVGESTKIKIKLPLIIYEYYDLVLNEYKKDSIILGKYYLYEGLAFGLDHIVNSQINPNISEPALNVCSEYRVIEFVAKHLAPLIDKRTLLEITSISLSWWNAGDQFINILTGLKKSNYDPQFLQTIEEKTKLELSNSLPGIEQNIEIIKNAVRKRAGMYAAVNYLTERMIEGYKSRIENLTFEVDVTYSGHTKNLNNYVPLCDMMYILDDANPYMKDYLGTYLSMDLSYDLKIYLCFVDYYQSMTTNTQSQRCPLFIAALAFFGKNTPKFADQHQD